MYSKSVHLSSIRRRFTQFGHKFHSASPQCTGTPQTRAQCERSDFPLYSFCKPSSHTHTHTRASRPKKNGCRSERKSQTKATAFIVYLRFRVFFPFFFQFLIRAHRSLSFLSRKMLCQCGRLAKVNRRSGKKTLRWLIISCVARRTCMFTRQYEHKKV